MKRRITLHAIALPAFLALTMLLAACYPVLQHDATAFSAAGDAPAQDREIAAGRLVVKGFDGNLYAMDARGSNTVMLTSDASPSIQYMQPSWSPAADRIAWTRVEQRDGELANTLIVADSQGADRLEFSVPFPPFYISWNPDGDRLAYLSSWSSAGRPSMVLRLVDPSATDDPITTLAEGQPFYLSWSPEGDRLLTHAQNERIDIQALDGSRQFLQRSAASFPAPQWFPSGQNLLYAVADNSTQRLIVAALDGAELAEITDYDGNITFTVSPDEQHIAYVVTTLQSGTAAFGPLYVVEVESGATRQLSELPVLAYFWSPDAQKLAFLAVDENEDDAFLFRWHVWDGSRITDYDAIIPTRTYVERYLTFFDQYAQSMSIWSPDSAAFTYAAIATIPGDNATGDPVRRTGVWVQHLDDAAPRYIGPGVYAAWSPK